MEELHRIRVALSAVARLDGRFGTARIAQVLVGSGAREILRWGLDRLPTYGKLQELGLKQAKELLTLLLNGNLLERRTVEGARPGTFVLALTPAGRAVMKGETVPLLALPDLGGPAEAPPLKAPRALPATPGAAGRDQSGSQR